MWSEDHNTITCSLQCMKEMIWHIYVYISVLTYVSLCQLYWFNVRLHKLCSCTNGYTHSSACRMNLYDVTIHHPMIMFAMHWHQTTTAICRTAVTHTMYCSALSHKVHAPLKNIIGLEDCTTRGGLVCFEGWIGSTRHIITWHCREFLQALYFFLRSVFVMVVCPGWLQVWSSTLLLYFYVDVVSKHRIHRHARK